MSGDSPVMPEIPLGRRAAAFQKLQKVVKESENSKPVQDPASVSVSAKDTQVGTATTATAAATATAATVGTVIHEEFNEKINEKIRDDVVGTAPVVRNISITEGGAVVASSVSTDASTGDKDNGATVSLNLDNIPGMQTEGEKYVIMFTCSICETRSARKISKKGYHSGVVICRCESCKNLHLIADRMGVFEDESWDIQKHILQLLERDDISVSHEEDVLEVTVDDESDEVEEDEGEDDGGESCADNIDFEKMKEDMVKKFGPKKDEK